MTESDSTSNRLSPEAAEEANDLLAGHAAEAMRLFVARRTDVDPSQVCFPDIVAPGRLVDLLTGLRHWARHVANDFDKADRLSRRRHEREYAAEAQVRPEE